MNTGKFLCFTSCLFLAGGVAIRTHASLTDGLIAYYPFDGNGNDQSGNGNNSTPTGDYTFVPNGLSGGAFQTTGDNAIWYSGGGHALLPTFDSSLNDGFTLSVWAKVQSIGGNPFPEEALISFGNLDGPLATILVNEYSATPYILFWMDIAETGPHPNIRQDVDLQTLADSWTHVVLSYAPGRMTAYYNGQNIGETNVTCDVFPVGQAALGRHWWRAGATESSARMSALYDNVRIYDRELSAIEISQLYQLESVPEPSTIGFFALGGVLFGCRLRRKGGQIASANRLNLLRQE